MGSHTDLIIVFAHKIKILPFIVTVTIISQYTMAGSKASKSQESPKSSNSPAKKNSSPSPPRKSVTKRESSRSFNLEKANQVKYKYVGIDNVAVGLILKPDGAGSAFMGNIWSHVEGNSEHMNHCQLMLITKLRNPDGSNEHLEVENKSGNKYPMDIVVFATEEPTTVQDAANNLARLLSNIAKNECAAEFKFGIPIFINKGDVTPPNVVSLNHYLIDEDCVTVMKRTFEGVDTKQDLMDSEFRDDILASIYGDTETGLQVIGGMIDELYDAL